MIHQNFIYDIECYKNVFTCAFLHHETGDRRIFEISARYNEMYEFLICLERIKSTDGARMVGFNNEGYDYPMIHYIMENGGRLDVADIYNKSNSIIKTPWKDRFSNVIYDRDRFIPQLDLFKIHHFDNVAKATSLKMLEFQMRRDTIQDLPYEPGTYLGDHEIDILKKYNEKDVTDTHAFFIESIPAIEFRDGLSAKYNMDMTNFNDTKIGKSYFAMRLEQAAPGCTKNQTPRSQIALSDVVFPYVRFERPEFNEVLDVIKGKVITETKGVLKGLCADVAGFRYVFGTGGIHGSIPSGFVESDSTHVIKDIDVTSYYPSLGISNRIHPAHLGLIFCEIYADIKAQRVGYKKGTPENAMLKLALNGVYGDSNNKYSPFYDPQYTMAITINGQLLLCMLSEQLIKIPGLKMIQVNTDGVTVRIPRNMENYLNDICAVWENFTKLDLEHAEYSRMWIRDVNNYVAEYAESGKLKSKGAYMHTGRAWHQNQSSLVVQKAVEQHITKGVNVSDFIYNHTDAFDFCSRTNVKRGSKLMWGDPETEQQRISRFFVVREGGGQLTKLMPPTPVQKRKNPNAPDRRIGIEVGHRVKICNDIKDFDWFSLNYQYYIDKAWELITPIIRRIS